MEVEAEAGVEVGVEVEVEAGVTVFLTHASSPEEVIRVMKKIAIVIVVHLKRSLCTFYSPKKSAQVFDHKFWFFSRSKMTPRRHQGPSLEIGSFFRQFSWD